MIREAKIELCPVRTPWSAALMVVLCERRLRKTTWASCVKTVRVSRLIIPRRLLGYRMAADMCRQQIRGMWGKGEYRQNNQRLAIIECAEQTKMNDSASARIERKLGLVSLANSAWRA